MSSRVGKLLVHPEQYDTRLAKVLIAIQFLPVAVERYLYMRRNVLTGHSEVFREVGDGEIIPEYEVLIHADGSAEVREAAPHGQVVWARPENSEMQWPSGEADPTGRKAHDPGAKLDAGKPRVWLVLSGFPRALEEVSKVGTFGAQKYSDNGWVDVPNGIARYSDAMGRHLLKEATGEKLAPDSGLMHAAHAAWNALARLELMLRSENEIDD